MKKKRIRQIALPLVMAALAVGSARAEDTRHKWQFGFGVSYFSTEDDIRSDADLQGCTGTGNTLNCTDVDPRRDKNVLNENSIGDDFRFDFSASYGLTRWFALEFAAGYFRGDIGNLENFRQFSEFNEALGRIEEQVFQENRFSPAGTITEIPLQLSALIRFRPESPFDPYFGGGFGYIFTDLKTSPAFDRLEAEINLLQKNDVRAPFGEDGIVGFDPAPGLPEELQERIGIPKASDFQGGIISDPLTIMVNDGPTFHIRGGVDYYFTEHISLYVDGTYTWTDPSVQIRVLGTEVGALSVGEVFLDKIGGKGIDQFAGPRVSDPTSPSGFRPATASDTCRDFNFSGLGGSLPECKGDDLDNDFIFDPDTESLGDDGFFNRTFGVCVGNCETTADEIVDSEGICINCPVYWVPEGELIKVCIGGSCKIDGSTGEPLPGKPVFEWIHTNNAAGFNLQNPFQVGRADDPVSTNTFIIQGGDIDLEGFSLGVGIKFTF